MYSMANCLLLMKVCVCECVCLSPQVCVSLCVGVNVSLYACQSLPGCVSAGVFLCVCVCVCVCVCDSEISDARLVEDSQ